MRSLAEAMQEFERDYLVRALAQVDGKKGTAAEALGISRKNLWEKLAKYGIGDDDADVPNLPGE
jgi:two-component system response regulator AtoC